MSVAGRSFRSGMRVGLGVAGPVFVLGLTFGAAAGSSGWDTGLTLLFSALTFSATAQFTLLTAMSSGALVAAVIAAVIINARYLVMSVALNDSLTGGRLRRMLYAQALADASFVVAHEGRGRFDVARMVGASVPQWLAWVSGTAIGVVVTPPPELMRVLGLDVAFPAFFVLLALDELRSSPEARLAAVVGGVIAGGLLFVTSPGYALLAAIAGTLVGLIPARGLRAEEAG